MSDDLSDVNAFNFTGYICTVPEKGLTKGGGAQLKFYVKTTKCWRDRDGNPHNESADIPVKLFGKAADSAAHFKMGDRVEVSGRLGSYSFEGKPPTLQFSFPSVKPCGTIGPEPEQDGPESPSFAHDDVKPASSMPDRSPQPSLVDGEDELGSLPF